MKLITVFDRKELLRRFARKQRPLFSIFFRLQGNRSYPSDDWHDFGCVLMGWWLSELLNLQGGSKHARLAFMEGPHALHLKSKGRLLLVSGEDGTQFDKVTVGSLEAEWCSTAEKAADYFLRNEVFPKEAENMRIGIRLLCERGAANS